MLSAPLADWPSSVHQLFLGDNGKQDTWKWDVSQLSLRWASKLIQCYASARVNNFLMSITNGSLNYETFLQEDNHRMFKVFRELLCLPSLSTMQISPSLSRKESRHYRVLYFLISDFFTFVNWRSVLESACWNFCKAPISLGNATLCTSLRTVFSALSSCSIRGVTSTWVVSASPCTRASDALLRLEREYPGKRSLQLVPFGKSGKPRQKVFVLINAFAVHKDLFNFRVFYGDIV